ncbi:glycosyltransferase [Rhodococcus wratislaviensis]|uniref:glycosyltransferase n=1 Tax=Rhodococcus wratislaviensis TaxID=44752 RepID=UPI003663B867
MSESLIGKTRLRKQKALALPFMPIQWRVMRGNYDWALISSHLFAHHVRFIGGESMEKYVYVHTPARYIWSPELDPRGQSAMVRAVAPAFKAIDRRRAAEATSFAANSKFVAGRVQKYWSADSVVIHPPVDVETIQSTLDWPENLNQNEREIFDSLPSDFVLGASRLVDYKRIDAVIRAGELVGVPVVIAGSGPAMSRLESLAQSSRTPVIFLGRVSDQLLYSLYSRCLVYAFLGVEDFGIMPVEAMAAGARVVANREGGAGESILTGITGSLCDPDDPGDLARAVSEASSCSSASSRSHSRKFDHETFESSIVDWVGAEKVARHYENVRIGGTR